MRKTPTRVSRFPGAARPARWRLAAALLAVLAALAPAPARAAEKPAAKDKGAAADKPGDKSADKAGEPRKTAPAERFLREAEGKLDNFTFGPADLAAAEKFAKQAKTPAARLPFDLLVARYQREYQSRPDRAAAAVLPHLFPKETVAAWERETARLRKEAPKAAPAKDGKAKTGAKEAQGGEGGEGAANAAAAPLAPLPPAGEWNLTPGNAPAAVEAAACLAAAGQVPEALAAAQRVGEGFKDVNHVLAVEVAGDVNMTMGNPAEALRAYDFGVKYIDGSLGAKVRRGENYVTEHAAGEKRLRARLERKRDRARRAAEAAMYGLDWALYRDATRDHWERRSPAEALLKYRELIAEYPDTVYAEAARCYAIKCLLALASGLGAGTPPGIRPVPGMKTPESAQAALRREVKAREAALAKAEKALVAARKAKICKPVLQRLEGAVAGGRKRLQDLRAVPCGAAAAKAAEKAAAEFLSGPRELGLYRGEALLALADHALEEEMDLGEAEKRYACAEEWLGRQKAADAALAAFTLPGAAQEATRPPATERYKDRWGNSLMSTVKPGELLNRRTATWYVPRLYKKVLLRRGLLRYLAGEYGEADKIWQRLYDYDPYFKELEADDWGSTCSRLGWACKNTPGALYLRPAEARAFKDKRHRLALFLADLNYMNEDRVAARVWYWRLLNGDFGKLSREERAGALYGLFACLCWDFDVDQTTFLDGYLADLRGTAVEARALVGLGNTTGVNGEPEQLKRSLAYYALLRKNCPHSGEAEESLYYSAERCRRWADHDPSKAKEALRFYNEYLKKYKNGAFVKLCQKRIQDLTNKGENDVEAK